MGVSAEESTGDRMSQEGGVDLKVDLGAIVTSLASLMTTPVDSNQSRATFISFNQDTTCVAVGTPEGYSLYSLNSTDVLDPVYKSDEQMFTSLKGFSVQALWQSSLGPVPGL